MFAVEVALVMPNGLVSKKLLPVDSPPMYTFCELENKMYDIYVKCMTENKMYDNV